MVALQRCIYQPDLTDLRVFFAIEKSVRINGRIHAVFKNEKATKS